MNIENLKGFLKVMLNADSVTNFQIKTVKDCFDAIKQQETEIERLERNNMVQHKHWSDQVVKNQSEIKQLQLSLNELEKDNLILSRKTNNQRVELNQFNSTIGKVKKILRIKHEQ